MASTGLSIQLALHPCGNVHPLAFAITHAEPTFDDIVFIRSLPSSLCYSTLSLMFLRGHADGGPHAHVPSRVLRLRHLRVPHWREGHLLLAQFWSDSMVGFGDDNEGEKDQANNVSLSSCSNDCSLEADLNESVESASGKVFTSIQLVKVNLRKKVRFSLEGRLPENMRRRKDGSCGLATPQIPRPGEKKAAKNVLRIERQDRHKLVVYSALQ